MMCEAQAMIDGYCYRINRVQDGPEERAWVTAWRFGDPSSLVGASAMMPGCFDYVTLQSAMNEARADFEDMLRHERRAVLSVAR